MPSLVCLTFGDKLYAEHMAGPTKHPSVIDMSEVVKRQVSVSFDVDSKINSCDY